MKIEFSERSRIRDGKNSRHSPMNPSFEASILSSVKTGDDETLRKYASLGFDITLEGHSFRVLLHSGNFELLKKFSSVLKSPVDLSEETKSPEFLREYYSRLRDDFQQCVEVSETNFLLNEFLPSLTAKSQILLLEAMLDVRLTFTRFTESSKAPIMKRSFDALISNSLFSFNGPSLFSPAVYSKLPKLQPSYIRLSSFSPEKELEAIRRDSVFPKLLDLYREFFDDREILNSFRQLEFQNDLQGRLDVSEGQGEFYANLLCLCDRLYFLRQVLPEEMFAIILQKVEEARGTCAYSSKRMTTESKFSAAIESMTSLTIPNILRALDICPTDEARSALIEEFILHRDLFSSLGSFALDDADLKVLLPLQKNETTKKIRRL